MCDLVNLLLSWVYVNIYLTDPSDQSLAEVEIMIAGDLKTLNVSNTQCFTLNVCMTTSSLPVRYSPLSLFDYLSLSPRAQLQRKRDWERGDADYAVLWYVFITPLHHPCVGYLWRSVSG